MLTRYPLRLMECHLYLFACRPLILNNPKSVFFFVGDNAFSSNSVIFELKYSFVSCSEAFCILLKYHDIAFVRSLHLKDLCVFGLKFSLARAS